MEFGSIHTTLTCGCRTTELKIYTWWIRYITNMIKALAETTRDRHGPDKFHRVYKNLNEIIERLNRLVFRLDSVWLQEMHWVCWKYYETKKRVAVLFLHISGCGIYRQYGCALRSSIIHRNVPGLSEIEKKARIDTRIYSIYHTT